MGAEGIERASPSGDARRPPVAVRPARWSDIGTLSRLYRAQPEESRRLYHPFPFSRLKLTAIFGYMVATRPFLRGMIARGRRRAALLLVATVPGRRRPIAYGNVGFVRKDGQPRAVFGYLVDPEFRGVGVGTRLHEVMIDEAVALGVVRGGGMVVTSNASNLRVLQKLGFEIRASDAVDSTVPGESNYVTDGNLVEIARRLHQAPGPEGTRSAPS